MERVTREEVKTAVEKAAELVARWLAQELEDINLEEQKKGGEISGSSNNGNNDSIHGSMELDSGRNNNDDTRVLCGRSVDIPRHA